MNRRVAIVKDVSFQYPDKQEKALDHVSFCVNEGEWLAIVGHNGSGKSTLAKLLLGLYVPKEGSIEVDGIGLTEETTWEVRRRIGMVFQNPDNQFVGTTVQDDVAFGLENAGIPQNIMVERVTDALKRVNMIEFVNQEPHHLSGGQKQRVAIAGVLALSPAIIVLDEATSMLDPIGRSDVLNTVRELKQDRNLTVISITHDLEEAAKADRLIVLNQGRIYKEGPPELIFSLEEDLIQLGLDIPFPVKMAKALRKNGIQVGDSVTEEGLVEDLCRLNSKM